MKLEIYGGPKHGGWSGHGEYERGIDPRLNSCPFCGSDEVEVSNTHTPYYHAECSRCGAEGPRNNAGDAWTRCLNKGAVTALHRQSFALAISDWNARPLAANAGGNPRERSAAKWMPDGMIKPGSNVGEQLGFTPSLFDGWLWKDGDRIMVSMIVSKREGQGNLSRLFASIEAHGLRVAVPSPLGHMQEILRHKDFVPHVERDETFGNVQVWMRPNTQIQRAP